MKSLYIVTFWHIQSLKLLYKKRGNEIKINAQVLSLLLILINAHSTLVFLEYFNVVNVGVIDFWYSTGKNPKSIYGYLFGVLFGAIYFLVIWFIDKKIKRINKFFLNRLIIKTQPKRVFSFIRSEERRVGKECRYRWSPYDLKTK